MASMRKSNQQAAKKSGSGVDNIVANSTRGPVRQAASKVARGVKAVKGKVQDARANRKSDKRYGTKGGNTSA